MCTFFLVIYMKDKYMASAYREAEKAFMKNEVPVGAVIVKDGNIIARAHNKKITTNHVYGHAEMLAIQKAARKTGDWRLNGCVMYVTLEPCPMCASAIQQSRLESVYIGTRSNIKSNSEIVSTILDNNEFNHKVSVYYVEELKCSKILTDFFAQKR